MAILAKGSEGVSFEPVPPGAHIARCVTVVDCGMQKIEWKGEEKWQHKVWIAFEVPGQRAEWVDKEGNEHEGPKIIGKLYTNSISEKSHMGQHLASWRGKAFTGQEIRDGFDVSVLLGLACQISVAHNESGGKVYANITGIMGIPAGIEAPAQETPSTLYDPTASEAPQVYETLPNWLKEKVDFGHNRTPENMTPASGEGDLPEPRPPENHTNTDFDDDIPF